MKTPPYQPPEIQTVPTGFVPVIEGVPLISCSECGAALKDIDRNWEKHFNWHRKQETKND